MQSEIIIVSEQSALEADKTTAQQVARLLVANNVPVREQISVCFDRVRLQQAISNALARSTVVVTIGGLGGAAGFLSKQVLSEGLRLPLVHSKEALRGIQDFCRSTGTAYHPEDVTFASLPQGSGALLPRFGKLPGCIISAGKQHVIMLPETRNEAVAMLHEQVLQVLAKASSTARSVHTLKTYGVTEPQVRRMLVDLMGTENPAITLQAHGEELDIKVTATGVDSETAAAMTNPVLRTIADRLGDYAYGLNIPSLEAAVVQKMRRKELDISVAEAGTSGMFGRVLGDTEGGQSLVRYHIMAETNESKTRQLGIPAKNLRRRGDVSEYTAVAMAHGAVVKGRSALGVGICADIPGVAQKEQAQVYIAICNQADVYVKKLVIGEGRQVAHDAVIDAAVARALNMTRLFVDYLPGSYHGSMSIDVALASKENITDGDEYQKSDIFAFAPEKLDTPMAPKSRKEKKKEKKEQQQAEKAKPKKKKSKIRRVALLLAISIFVGSAGYLGLYTYRSFQALSLRDDMAGVYSLTKFMGLTQYNSDVVAYISIDDTDVNYPIVQAKDNAFYYRRNFLKEDDNHGIPYVDYTVNMNQPSDNIVVYGHNMMDGQIFGELLKYQDLAYYKEHPIINFDTKTPLDTAREGKYKIMSIFITNTYVKHGPIFNYHKQIDMSDQAFATYLKQLEIRSLITTTVDTRVGDELITLSTCDYNFSGSRFVVVARRVRPGENTTVDTASAIRNPQPLLPDVWYKSFGGSSPDAQAIEAAGGLDGTKMIAYAGKYLGEKIIEPTNQPLLPTSSQEESSEESSQQEIVSSQEESTARAEASALEQAKEQEAKKAEEARLAAEKLAKEQAEQEKKEQEQKEQEAQKAQETKAIEAEKTAKEQAEIATAAAEAALESTTAKVAMAQYEIAAAASQKATTAASEAKTAADAAGTEVAQAAQAKASGYAATASRAAAQAKDLGDALHKQEEEKAASTDTFVGNTDLGTLTVNGNTQGDALDIISRIVQNEVGSGFHPEAIKAQAVAAYTFVAHANARGNSPSVYLSAKADSKVVDLVQEVLGEAIYYNGNLAFTPYHATSAGSTTSSASVWGGSYPYLVEVDSSVDERARNYSVSTRTSASKVAAILSDKLNIDATGDPAGWFEILSYEPGGYIGRMSICGETKSPNTGNTITGRLVRESVLHLRSSNFTIEYNASSDEFVFTTYGYGHGVGMSQTGANLYAQDGWSYRQILAHYYPGTTLG